MIEVEQLSKRYGQTLAVENLSFEVGRGEIVGLLGPNGAGKSTTMRILSTFLEPTTGRARLGGHDLFDEPIQVRKSLGYLPETVPLYPEMRVREFLGFRAKLKEIPRSRRRFAIDDVVQQCRLEEVRDRIIGQLSRGYRQRVGLADALLASPEILILDEPTAGLDPIQIGETRALIRGLAARHTILLSTHILSEVESVCSRVIIIAGGKIALDSPLSKLQAGRGVALEVRGPLDAVQAAIRTAPGVASVEVRSVDQDRELSSLVVNPEDEQRLDLLREQLAERVYRNGWKLRVLDLSRSTLEDEFVRAVRDASMQRTLPRSA